ncbi:MAG: hypothetical protein WCF85_06045 [Rhodospirillaceae bacterium]
MTTRTARTSRCLDADPYYLSLIPSIVLPLHLLSGWSATDRAAYQQALGLIRNGRAQAARAPLEALEAALAGIDRGLCAATLAMIDSVAGHDDRVGAGLARSLAAAPDCGEYHHFAGSLAVRTREIAAAIGHFEDAVRLDPGLGPAWAALALLHGLSGDWAQAEEPARLALAAGCELGPSLIDYCLMFALHYQGKPVTGPFLLPGAGGVSEPALARLLARLPAVDFGGSPPWANDAEPTVFVCCDSVYLAQHAVPLALSLAACGAAGRLHIHVINPEPGDAARLDALSVRLIDIPLTRSFETVEMACFGAPAVYYSCARFCRFYQFIKASGRPALMVDADVLFRQPPGKAIVGADFDIALLDNPGGPPWERFIAGAVYCAATPAALAFLTRVGFFIGQNLIARKGRWFMDQIALTLAFEAAGPDLRVRSWSSARMFDLTHGPDSILWTVTRFKSDDDPYNRYKRALLSTAPD